MTENAEFETFRVLVEGNREASNLSSETKSTASRGSLAKCLPSLAGPEDRGGTNLRGFQFLLRIRDDGKGIDAKYLDHGSRAGHWGLPGMRERAKTFGGRLEIWSQGGAGTEVELTVLPPSRIDILGSISLSSNQICVLSEESVKTWQALPNRFVS